MCIRDRSGLRAPSARRLWPGQGALWLRLWPRPSCSSTCRTSPSPGYLLVRSCSGWLFGEPELNLSARVRYGVERLVVEQRGGAGVQEQARSVGIEHRVILGRHGGQAQRQVADSRIGGDAHSTAFGCLRLVGQVADLGYSVLGHGQHDVLLIFSWSFSTARQPRTTCLLAAPSVPTFHVVDNVKRGNGRRGEQAGRSGLSSRTERPREDEEYVMLTVTQNAVTEIRNLTDQPQAPEGGGVRIATDPTVGNLTLSLAAMPAEDDTVLDADGARLFLDSSTTTLLDDKTLDAVTDPSGQVQFGLAEQPT